MKHLIFNWTINHAEPKPKTWLDTGLIIAIPCLWAVMVWEVMCAAGFAQWPL